LSQLDRHYGGANFLSSDPARFLRSYGPDTLELDLSSGEQVNCSISERFEVTGQPPRQRRRFPHIQTIRDGRPSDYERSISAEIGQPPLPIPALREDAVWTIMYTSGTTGRPKGATITYGMVDCLTSHCVAKVGLSTRSVSLTVLPMFHIKA